MNRESVPHPFRYPGERPGQGVRDGTGGDECLVGADRALMIPGGGAGSRPARDS
jgi:hypothetical protein